MDLSACLPACIIGSMESASKTQLIKEAINQLMEEVGSTHDDHHLLLSKLMAQLEAEAEGGSPELLNTTNISRPEQEQEEEEEEEERIVKELKKLKRQNLITHCLLSVMIVLTVAWQISEVSIILKLKDGVTHPFRSIGSMLKSVVKPRRPNGNANQEDTETSITSNLIESTPVHDLKMPKIDLPFNAQH